MLAHSPNDILRVENIPSNTEINDIAELEQFHGVEEIWLMSNRANQMPSRTVNDKQFAYLIFCDNSASEHAEVLLSADLIQVHSIVVENSNCNFPRRTFWSNFACYTGLATTMAYGEVLVNGKRGHSMRPLVSCDSIRKHTKKPRVRKYTS